MIGLGTPWDGLSLQNPRWRETEPREGLAKRLRFPFLRHPSDPRPRPLVIVQVASGRAACNKVVVPGLIDSGCSHVIGPRTLLEAMGLRFDKGLIRAAHRGLGGETGPARQHQLHLTVLGPEAGEQLIAPAPGADEPKAASEPKAEPTPPGRQAVRARAAFGPFYVDGHFQEGDLPFLLLGQSDFLRRFGLHLYPKYGFFELEWLP